MDFWTALVAVTSIGCGTGVVCMVIDKFSQGRLRAFEAARKIDEERLRLAQESISVLEQQNRQLQQQVEWHMRLAAPETQAPRAASESPALASARTERFERPAHGAT